MSDKTILAWALELNNSGAWKRLMTIRVDSTTDDIEEAKTIAHEMGSMYARLGGRMKWRIVIEEKQAGGVTANRLLNEWLPETGWRDA